MLRLVYQSTSLVKFIYMYRIQTSIHFYICCNTVYMFVKTSNMFLKIFVYSNEHHY
jgi:hypothetical protein